MTTRTYVLHSTEETKALAATFTESLNGGEFVALVGDLGSGKTTFVQGLVEALGATAKVKSPTFTLMNVYPTSHKTIKQIVHVDFYRVPDAHLDLALHDYERPDTVIVAEWPKRRDLKKRPIIIRFAHGTSINERTIEM